jgi:S1-C subfamily serine protease
MKRLFLAFITGVALIGTTWTAFAATLFSLVILLALTASCFADGSGSGFVVRKEGYVVTNHHVIEGAKEIWVKVPGKTIDFRASVVIDNSVHDLALLKIQDTSNTVFDASQISD